MSEADALLTTAEAARYLGVTPSALVYWRTRHTGPRFVRMGEGVGRVRYRPADLAEYATANTVEPNR